MTLVMRSGGNCSPLVPPVAPPLLHMTHKKDVTLRPILLMIGSAQHELAKYLAGLL